MRERKNFAERTKTRNSDEVMKKYFLVYEGKETEVKYFDAVNDLRQEIGLNPIIELRPLVRSYSEDGWSNPKKILKRIIKNLEENNTGEITYETLLNRIMDYLYDERIITTSKTQAASVWEIMNWYCNEKLQKSLSAIVSNFEKDSSEICKYLEKEANITNIVNSISDIIKNQKITYDENFDKICLIVDRDKDSFVSHPENNQYEYVLNTCKNKKFGFYLTNPCFEFWLLLHFDKVVELDKAQLLENPKVTSKRRYVEQQLRNFLPDYQKVSYDAHALVNKLNHAIKNEKLFCENIEQLENAVGSNIGLLIEEMRG